MSCILSIDQQTLANKAYRKVVATPGFLQIVIMCLKPKEEIGLEMHKGDQFLKIVAGRARVTLDGKVMAAETGDAIVVKHNTYHNIINTSSKKPLQLYTLYAPPEHPPKTFELTKSS